MGKLDGKVAVITGGASGIGRASVQLFIEEGAHVVFGDIQDDKGKTFAEELGPNASYFHTNVRKESEIKAIIDFAVEKFGHLDIMFNNAGFGGVGGLIEETLTDAFDVTMEVLFRSVVLGMKHAAPVMKKQGSGVIISTASVAGLRTGFGTHIYSALKAAIIHLTRTVAMELGEDGIRVNCICPGSIPTAIFGRGFGLPQDAAERLAELLKIPFANSQPIKRTGLPDDIAKAALWLVSDDSSFVNGHALVVDGGLIGGKLYSETIDTFNELTAILKLGDVRDIMRKINEEIAKTK